MNRKWSLSVPKYASKARKETLQTKTILLSSCRLHPSASKTVQNNLTSAEREALKLLNSIIWNAIRKSSWHNVCLSMRDTIVCSPLSGRHSARARKTTNFKWLESCSLGGFETFLSSFQNEVFCYQWRPTRQASDSRKTQTRRASPKGKTRRGSKDNASKNIKNYNNKCVRLATVSL